MNEAQYQKRVTDYCDLLHLTWTHFRPAISQSGKWSTPIAGRKGFPDLVIAGPGGHIFVELKSDTGRLSADQRHWLLTLAAGGAEVYTWAPKDWAEAQTRLVILSRPRVVIV